MIKRLIAKCITDKLNVRVYCSLGNGQYSYVSGLIVGYIAGDDSIRMNSITGDAQEILIPFSSIHSITPETAVV